jgi:hypothetical protein
MRRRRRPDQSRFADTVFAGGIAPIAVELGGSVAAGLGVSNSAKSGYAGALLDPVEIQF